ncbi:MAG: DUF1552 domain-containing protein [Planctomycetes bacterium]|nr:DUF1552 domain-containing protein [Planctomycetota bacterium]
MSTRSWHISRRTMLRGLGAAVALPLLDVMEAPTLFGADPKVVPRKQPVRFAALYMPNGVNPHHWSPAMPGPLSELPSITAAFEKVKSEITLISGLCNKGSFPLDGHYAKVAVWLSGTSITKTTGADLNSGGISADQLAAQFLGQYTRLPSIELSTHNPTNFVDNNVKLTALYGSHISWSTPTTPQTRETDPKAAFDRLFRGQGGADAGAARPKALNPWDDSSVLDFVLDDSAGLKGRLGVNDQRKLDEYLTSVRDVERRIQAEIKHVKEPHRVDPAALRALPELGERVRKVGGGGRFDNPQAYAERVRMMLDIILLAFWTDSTRIATFMFGNEVSGQNFSFIEGVKGGHHDMSHHENNADKLEQYRKIGLWHAQQVAGLFERMKAIKEGKDTLLDNSMVLFGSGIRDGNAHDPHNLPIVIGGSGGKTIATGRHIVCKNETPMCNLLGDILARMGLQVDKFADSTGPLKELAG